MIPRLSLFLFAVASVLRLALAIVNREANDDHLEVTRWILDHGGLPLLGDCWECYQPKLYHLLVAAVIQLFGLSDESAQAIAGQMVNVCFGVGTLWVARRFLRESIAHPRVELLLFGLLAFNPRLLSIHIQATNDAAVVFCSVLACWKLWRYLESESASDAWAAVLATVLAGLAKGSGWFVFFWVAVVLTVRWIVDRRGSAAPARRFAPGRALLVLVLTFGSVVPIAGPYAAHWQRFGSPFVMNIPKDPPPKWSEPTVARRPGVLSIRDAFLTFRLRNLIERPYTTHDNAGFPRHRTSLWTQMYGQTASLWFSQWPKSWTNRTAVATGTSRALILLCLLPLSLGLSGLTFDGRRMLRALRAGPHAYLRERREWIFPLLAASFAAMMFKLSHDYRDFSVMKAIYIFPALLAPLCWIGLGMSAVETYVPVQGRRAVEGLLWCLVLVSAIEAFELLFWLSR